MADLLIPECRFEQMSRNGSNFQTNNREGFCYIINFTNGKYTYPGELTQLSCLQQLWSRTFFRYAAQEQTVESIDAGESEFTSTFPIDVVLVALDITDFKGNLTNLANPYGNFGYMTFVDSNGYHFPTQWLNYKKTRHQSPHPNVQKCYIYLKDGITAGVTLKGMEGAPPMKWGGSALTQTIDPYRNVY